MTMPGTLAAGYTSKFTLLPCSSGTLREAFSKTMHGFAAAGCAVSQTSLMGSTRNLLLQGSSSHAAGAAPGDAE